jgi:predicted nucleic acid-binding protein
MTGAVPVETSVWIDHLRGTEGLRSARLATWRADEPDRILVNEVVTTELLQGLRSEADAAELHSALEKLVQAEPLGPGDWLLSARTYRTCRQAGLTIRSPMDCLIAAHSIRLQVPALAVDRNFDAIATCTGLRVIERP